MNNLINNMPTMTGVNACFDGRIGVEDTVWKNLTGDIDVQLYNPKIYNGNVEVVGSEDSYGKFTKSYVSGSSRTWYFVFKNISGIFTSWRTIVGNEAATYKCSTIAMNGNGKIQFTRPEITQIGRDYNCSEWHVVSWVSNGSTSETTLYIDGIVIGSVSSMQGWANDTFLARGSDWYYADNNTAFRAIAIADVAHTNDEIVSNSTWLYENFITNYVEIPTKYLIKSNEQFYNIVDGELNQLTIDTLTHQSFIDYGLDELPEWNSISNLINPEILRWQEILQDISKLTATMAATPFNQNMTSNRIDLTDPTITGIEAMRLTCEGNPLVAVSFDEKATWHVWNDTEWLEVSDEFTGMTKDIVESITYDEWLLLYTGAESLYIRVSFTDTETKLSELFVDFTN